MQDKLCQRSDTFQFPALFLAAAVDLMAAWIASCGERTAAELLAHRGNLFGLHGVELHSTFSPGEKIALMFY